MRRAIQDEAECPFPQPHGSHGREGGRSPRPSRRKHAGYGVHGGQFPGWRDFGEGQGERVEPGTSTRPFMCYPALHLMPPSKTGTPVLAFTPDLIYMLGNVSSLVNVKWYLGE